MIRALGLFALALTAACVAHASPMTSAPQACTVGPAPQDPYVEAGEAGGEAGADPAQLAFSQRCGRDRTCSFECEKGGCSYYCAEGSTCNVECDGGGCQLACAPGATCNFECDGGRCGTGCGAGATCNIECDGGSCAHACAPEATCHVECEGGNCVS
jgi:hypothetical protein